MFGSVGLIDATITHLQDQSMTVSRLISLNDEEFLHEAYRLVLGREIDFSGLEQYRGKLAQGRSKQWVLVALARSKEAQARFAPAVLMELPDEEFVDAAYIRLLGRNADAEGMRHYIDQLGMHGDRVKVFNSIGSSQEARRHDPVGWAFRQELDALIRRQTSFLGWRRWLPKGQAFASFRQGTSHGDLDVFAKEMLQVQRTENALLKDQITLLASAVEGVASAQKRDAARLEELIAGWKAPDAGGTSSGT